MKAAWFSIAAGIVLLALAASAAQAAPPTTESEGVDPATISAETADREAVDWQQYLGPNEPDQNLGITPKFSDFLYDFAPGGVLLPRDSDVTWDYHSGGCISMPSGNDWFTFHLDLPQGSRIDYLRLYYFDDDEGYVRAHIMSYDGVGTASTLTTISSTGTGGYGSELSDYLGLVVDNFANGYSLIAKPSTNTTNLRICGLRVAYRLPS